MTTATITAKKVWTKTRARDIRPNDELRDGIVLQVEHTSRHVAVTIETATGRQSQLIRADEFESVHRPLNVWLPASGGSEEPFATRTGRTFLYCWNQSLAEHRYYDVGRDLILDDSEAWFHLSPPAADCADLH